MDSHAVDSRPAMALERGPKRGPCANVGCPDPDNPSGRWNWLHSVKDLDDLDIREDAVKGGGR